MHAGRARSALIEEIKIPAYNDNLPLKQLALISLGSKVNCLTVEAYDVSISKDIEKALTQTHLSLSVQRSGKVLLIVVPALSAERQQQYVKQAKEWAEQQRIAIRNVRRNALKQRLESDDATKQLHNSVEKACRDALSEIDAILNSKVQELSKS